MSEPTGAPSWPLDAGPCRLRPFREGDEASLAHHANDRGIWENVRDLFPHPYTLEDAVAWIGVAGEPEVPTSLAIEVDGAVVGGCGFVLGHDIHRFSAEIGYWIGREHWGRGVMSAAVARLVRYGFETFGFERVWAGVIDGNAPSIRVLEKNGFVHEGVHRRAIFKDGRYRDEVMLGLVRGDWAGAAEETTDR
jgi:RimJ/RimL family protein N-acetyltransferase